MRLPRSLRAPAALLLVLALALPAWAGATRVKVTRINDGDTITVRLKKGDALVRLIGVDAPETRHSKGLERRAQRHKRTPQQEAAAGARARLAVEKMLSVGDKVVLVDGFPESDERDRYGRLLAFVYLPDGRLLNLELISGGWARAYAKFNYRHKKDFLQAEQQARRAKKGLWAIGGP